jgi:maleate cis-trans isomerase
METLILSCLQAQLIAGRVYQQNIPKHAKNDLIWEIKQVAPKECKIDAKAD